MEILTGLFNDIIIPTLKILPFVIFYSSPIMVVALFLSIWQRYIRTDFISKQDYMLLEIKISKDIVKTPLAMEVFLTSIWQSGSVTYTNTYWDGKMRTWFSLEIASFGGNVKFFIWTQSKFRKLVESQIYAQYPNVEISEADDYTSQVKHNPKEVSMWGTYYRLGEKDAYPLKTYIDYGLEKAGDDEEFKVDPFTSMIEYLGSIGQGEQIWFQILIQAHKKEAWREGRFITKPDWKKEATKEVEKIRKDSTLKVEGSPYPGFPNPTKGQQEKIAAIERSIGKYAYDTMIRAFYIAKNENFNPIGIVGLIGSVKQYNSYNLNSLKLAWYTDHSDDAKDWIQIFSFVPGVKQWADKKRLEMEYQLLEAYKMRSIFHPPYRNYNAKPFILTTEELATIYHFPGTVATTPTLTRIPSKKATPPANLPV